MATLFELTGQAKALSEMLISNDIDEATYKDTLEGLDIETKLENYCKIIKNYEADAKAYKEMKDSFADKQKVAENAVKRMKEAIMNYLNETGQSKAAAGLFTVTKSTSEAVNVTDISKLPSIYVLPQEPKIDKTAIKQDIKAGHKIDGAELATSEYVRIK